MIRKKVAYALLASMVSGLLIGCGGEDASNNSTVDPQIQELKVSNGLVTLKPNEPGVVELKPYVSGANENTALSVANLDHDDPRCGNATSDANNLSFVTTVNGSAMCRYQYTLSSDQSSANTASNGVMPQSGQLSAVMTVVGTTSAAALAELPLQNLSGSVNTPLVIDLPALLSSSMPAGYTLSSSVSLVGDGFIETNVATNVITFTPYREGIHTLYYQLEDPVAENHKFGALMVTVASVNPGSIKLVRPLGGYAYDATVGNTSIVDIGWIVRVDVIGDWKLESISSIGVHVELYDPQDPSNKKFIIKPSKVGVFNVAFTVADTNGGYDFGVIKFRVDAGFSHAIAESGYIFHSPGSPTKLDKAGIPYSGSFIESNNTYPTMTYTEAVTHCEVLKRIEYLGRKDWYLPPAREVDWLYSTLLNSSLKYYWPFGTYYATSELGYGEKYKTYHMEFGIDSWVPVFTPSYGTCASRTILEPMTYVSANNGAIFLAPITSAEARNNGVNYTEESVDVDGQTYALFNWSQGDSMCRAYGNRLPTERELLDLYAEKGNITKSIGWPTGNWMDYWSSTVVNGLYKRVDLANGKSTSGYPSGARPVSCVKI